MNFPIYFFHNKTFSSEVQSQCTDYRLFFLTKTDYRLVLLFLVKTFVFLLLEANGWGICCIDVPPCFTNNRLRYACSDYSRKCFWFSHYCWYFFLVAFAFVPIILEGFVWVEARTALKPSSSTNFTIQNKCDYPVWPVINGTSTEFSISTTCFVLKKGEASLISVCPSTTPNKTRLVEVTTH